MKVRKSLLGEFVLAFHVPDRRPKITGVQPRTLITVPESFKVIHLENDGVQKAAYPMTRVWIAKDELPSGGADSWMAQLDERFGPQPEFHDGSIDLWRLACQVAYSQKKKFSFIVTNEYGAGNLKQAEQLGKFSAEVLKRLAEIDGAWGIVGNQAMGTITQEWFDAFMVPELVDELQAGHGGFGIHDGYCYTAQPAGLMRFTSTDQEGQDREWDFLGPHFMGPEYKIKEGSANQPVDKWDEPYTLPPVPTPENLHEAHLVGRFFKYVDVPDWLPVFVTEAGADQISLEQAQAWGAPWKDDRGDGIPGVYTGLIDLESLITRTYGAQNPGKWYALDFLGWLDKFYQQYENVFGVTSWCTGNNNFDPEAGEDDGWQKFDGDRIRAWDFSRAAIELSPMIEQVPAWEWAQHKLTPEEPPEEPPVEIPPEEPPEDPPAPVLNLLLATLATTWKLEAEAMKAQASALKLQAEALNEQSNALKIQADARHAAGVAIVDYLASAAKKEAVK